LRRTLSGGCNQDGPQLNGCGYDFRSVSIVAVSFEIDRKLEHGQDPSIGDQAGNASNDQMVSDTEELHEPHEPPKGLMHKRRHPAVWIAFALLLGGLIALVLAALVTS
jgi:hypothetical protein